MYDIYFDILYLVISYKILWVGFSCLVMFRVKMCQEMSRCPKISHYGYCLWDLKIDCYNFARPWRFWLHSPVARIHLNHLLWTSRQKLQRTKICLADGGRDCMAVFSRLLHIRWGAGTCSNHFTFSCLGMPGHLQNIIYIATCRNN